jgi:hypothetical protein
LVQCYLRRAKSQPLSKNNTKNRELILCGG